MTYEAIVSCLNCGFAGNQFIVKGKQIKETKCDNCGCKTLIFGKQDISEFQERLLCLLNQVNVEGMSLREVGEFVGVNSPQKVKHHLTSLEKKGLIRWNKKKKKIEITNLGKREW